MPAEPVPIEAEVEDVFIEQLTQFAEAVRQQLAEPCQLQGEATAGAVEFQVFLELGLTIVARHHNLMSD